MVLGYFRALTSNIEPLDARGAAASCVKNKYDNIHKTNKH